MIAQIAIAVLGVSAIWLVARTDHLRRWGYVCGLFAQPFWLWTTLDHGQYLIAGLCLLYGAGWFRGWRNHWRLRPAQEHWDD